MVWHSMVWHRLSYRRVSVFLNACMAPCIFSRNRSTISRFPSFNFPLSPRPIPVALPPPPFFSFSFLYLFFFLLFFPFPFFFLIFTGFPVVHLLRSRYLFCTFTPLRIPLSDMTVFFFSSVSFFRFSFFFFLLSLAF